jgi:hypothetical protein
VVCPHILKERGLFLKCLLGPATPQGDRTSLTLGLYLEISTLNVLESRVLIGFLFFWQHCSTEMCSICDKNSRAPRTCTCPHLVGHRRCCNAAPVGTDGGPTQSKFPAEWRHCGGFEPYGIGFFRKVELMGRRPGCNALFGLWQLEGGFVEQLG